MNVQDSWPPLPDPVDLTDAAGTWTAASPTSPAQSPAGIAEHAGSGTDQLWVGPLTDPIVRDAARTGRDVAGLATAAELWRVPATRVAVAALGGWATRRTSPDPLPELSVDGPVSVRAWLVAGGRSESVGPIWYNLDPASMPEAVLELVGVAARTVPDDGRHTLVITFQDFVAPEISATVVIDPRADRVELRSCRGIDEDLGAGVWRDTLILAGPNLDLLRHEVVHKPTATEATAGGTRVVAVEPALRGRPTLPVGPGRSIAGRAVRTADRLGGGVRLELALRDDDVHLLACRLD
jgi:hypothetical protein